MTTAVEWSQLVLQAIGAGVATWFGAWAAFRHERADRIRQRKQSEGAVLKHALFVLIAQRTLLQNIWDQHLGPAEHHELRHIALHPFYVAEVGVSLDLEPLLFLLDSSDADLLNRLLVGNRRVRTILDTVALRNTVHVEGQKSAATLPQEGVQSADEFRRRVGADRWQQLADFTDALYQNVGRALREVDTNYAALEGAAKKGYPGLKLFKVTALTLPTNSSG